MAKLRSRVRTALLVGIAAIIAVAVVFFVRGNSAAIGVQWKDSGSLGSWRFEYGIHNDEGTYAISYDYPRNSAADVRAAASAMNQTAASFAKAGTPFRATVVFARPLSIDEFTAFARTTGISPTQSELRALDSNGRPLKVGIASEYAHDATGRLLIGHPLQGGEPIDTAALARMQAGGHSFTVVGVISTEVTLDRMTFAKIQRDGRVFAVDVLPEVLTAEVQRQHPGVAAASIWAQDPLLYPAMEATGLAPKRQS